MSAGWMIETLARNGISLRAEGDRLVIRGRVAAGDMDKLREHRDEIVALLHAADREGLPEGLVHRLDIEDIAACAGLGGDTLRAYLRALDRGERMDAGEVPPGFTVARSCAGCGPVWLWRGAPLRVEACPWCYRRKAGKRVPRP